MIKRKRNFKLKITIAIIVSIVLMIIIDENIRPVIKNMAGYQGKLIATNAINQGVYEDLKTMGDTYDRIVIINKNKNEEITSIEIDSILINKLKASITKRILDKISKIDQASLNIPIGTFFGSQFFAGQGPRIKFRIIPNGIIQTDINSQFSEAGINQTKHQIIINIKAKVTSIIPGYSATSEVSSNFIVSETIIIGKVPNYTFTPKSN